MDAQIEGNRLDVSCFTADFWEDKVFVAGKSFPVGQFVVDLLNMDVNAATLPRLSVRNISLISEQLAQGFIYPRDFYRAKDDFADCLNFMREIRPLSLLDMDYEQFRLERMMEDSHLEKLQEYLLLKGKLAGNNQLSAYDWYKPNEGEKRLLSDGEFWINELSRTLRFYICLGEDIFNMLIFAIGFIRSLPSIGQFNESNLITKLMEKVQIWLFRLNY